METSLEASHKATLVVVLGMHRSGTSAITRALATMGAEFGSRLMPAVAGVNDKGFFEDLDINAINMEVMAAAGMDWHAMAPIELDGVDRERLNRLQTKAIALLRDKCQDKTFALKDPRIVRLLPFWQPVFACLGAHVMYVIAVRNPISVARSLAKRDGFPEEKSYVLWLAHIVPALLMTRDSVRVIIDYDKLMDFPSRELSQISSQLGLPLDAQRVAEFEKEFLDDQLRNTRFVAEDLSVVRSAPRQVKELAAALEIASCACDARIAAHLNAKLEGAQTYLGEIAPLLRYEWRKEKEAQQRHAMLTDCSHRIGALDEALRESENHAKNTRMLLEQLSRENRSRKEAVARILDSMSWRVTALFRAMRRCMSLRTRRVST